PSSTASALAVLLAVSRNKTSTNLQPQASPIRWYGKWGQVNGGFRRAKQGGLRVSPRGLAAEKVVTY
ncbi:MAG: hypothetical protein NZ533_06520, partial [Casimicrobiaceae bacterium]|nr:hypothetical protein [Casimicrobiaceae bacterium]